MSLYFTKNGISERKNWHLIEIACSLMLNTNVHVHHWEDAFLTTCFLINRVPSYFIENKVLHSIIWPNDPLYHVSPRVFGYTCFVHNVFPSLDELFAKVTKCFFFRYSRLQKGYKCYSPSTKSVSFFSSIEDRSFVQQVLPLPLCDPLVISATQTQHENDIIQ